MAIGSGTDFFWQAPAITIIQAMRQYLAALGEKMECPNTGTRSTHVDGSGCAAGGRSYGEPGPQAETRASYGKWPFHATLNATICVGTDESCVSRPGTCGGEFGAACCGVFPFRWDLDQVCPHRDIILPQLYIKLLFFGGVPGTDGGEDPGSMLLPAGLV